MGGASYIGVTLRMDSANERRYYYTTLSLISRAHTQNDPCIHHEQV